MERFMGGLIERGVADSLARLKRAAEQLGPKPPA